VQQFVSALNQLLYNYKVQIKLTQQASTHQGCGLGRDFPVSRRPRDVLTSRLGLGSEGLVHIPGSHIS